MKRTFDRLRHSAASLAGLAALLLLLLFAGEAGAQNGNFCNNAVPPCNPDEIGSPCYTPPKPKDECEPIECNKCTKSPCYVGSGVYTTQALDLAIRTVGLPIAVTRLYESSHAIDGQNGYGWVSGLSARLHYAVYLKSAPDTYAKEARVRLPTGRIYRFVQNANGTFSPPEGRFDSLVQNGDGTWDLTLQRSRARFHFSATGQLLQSVDDYGNTLVWTHTGGVLSRVADAAGSGRYIDITYGADGRISDVTDMSGRNVHYAYDPQGMLTGVTNPLGQTTTYSYVTGKYAPLLGAITDHWGRSISTIVYDTRTRVTSYTDQGETYTYTYAYGGNPAVTAKTDASGNVSQFVYNSDGLVTESRFPGSAVAHQSAYRPDGLPDYVIDRAGVKTAWTYNANGLPLTAQYDQLGSLRIEWRMAYDPAFPEQLLSLTPYDPVTNQLRTDWQAHRYDYHPVGSAAPGALHHEYRVRSDGVTVDTVWTYTYNARGQLLNATNAVGAMTSWEYDAAGNLAAIELPSNNSAGTRPRTTYTHDALGRVTSMSDAGGKTTTYAYDVLDRETSITLPKPSPSSTLVFTKQYTYDLTDTAHPGVLFVHATDPNGRVTRFGRNAFGQMVRSIDALGKTTSHGWSGGLLRSITDPNGYITTFQYDALRRHVGTTSPDGSQETLVYRLDGLLGSRTDRQLQRTDYAYDALKRISSQTHVGVGSITYTYQGQNLTQVVDTTITPSETHALTWDSSFRIVTEAQSIRGTIQFTYDAADRLASTAVVGGATSTYGRYADGTLHTIQWSPVTGQFAYTYLPTGETATVTFPNGQTRVYSYDDQGRITQVANSHPTAGNIANFTYAYDQNHVDGSWTMLGQRVGMTVDLPAQSLSSALTKYYYDAAYQLVRADYPSGTPFGGATHSWTYDSIGNRTSSTVGGTATNLTYYKFGGNSNNSDRLSSDGTSTYAHDANGNVTARTGYSFVYDAANRMTSSSGGGVTASYRYDFTGRRSAKTVGSTTEYLYDGSNVVRESGAANAEYLSGGDIDEPLAMIRGGEIFYYSVDALGSVAALTNASGAVQKSYVYDAWGETRGETGTLANPFGYTAREQGDAGLLFYRARFLSPAIGRFLQEDPVSLRLRAQDDTATIRSGEAEVMQRFDANLYSYVENSPPDRTDAFGLMASSRGKVPVNFSIPAITRGQPGARPGEFPGQTIATFMIGSRCFYAFGTRAQGGLIGTAWVSVSRITSLCGVCNDECPRGTGFFTKSGYVRRLNLNC